MRQLEDYMARLASEVAICNRAMTRIGQRGSMTDFETPTNEEERMCLLWYDETVDVVLREYHYNCATKIAELVATTAPTFGFGNAFTLPTDYLMAISEDSGYNWSIEAGVLNTDFDTFQLKYTALIDADSFDAHVGRVMEIELAIVFAQRFEQSSTMVARLIEQREQLILKNARYTHSAENDTGVVFDDEILNGRLGGPRSNTIDGPWGGRW